VLFTFQAGERPVKNVTIFNAGPTPVYVSVSIEQGMDLLSDPVEYEPTTDLLLSPKNFSIAPNGRRTVRMLLKSSPEQKERVYRVLFIPHQSEFGEEQVKGGTFAHGSLVMKVATGVGILVFSEPKNPKKDLIFTRDAKGVTFSNNGNYQTQISDGVTCPSSVTLSKAELALASDYRDSAPLEKKGCTRFEGRRLHAGKSLFITAPAGHRVYYKRRFGSKGELEPQEIDPT
jgi:P pilus assembly chaperone PapD